MATHSSLFLCIVILLVFIIMSTNGLQCYICGQFNDGQGSITPCTNYTVENAHLHLKECPRKTDKFCVVSKRFLTLPPSSSFPQIYIFNYNFFLHVSSKNCFCCLFAGRKTNKKMFMEMKNFFS